MNVEEEKRAIQTDDQVKESSSYDQVPPPGATTFNANGAPVEEEEPKKSWWKACLEPGHAAQIVLAAAVAIAIGVGVTAAVGSDNVPPAVPVLLEIPGRLWLRCLQCVVIPMIVTAIILAVMSLREITAGGKILGRWTVGYYVLTTILAVAFSVVMTSQVWTPLIPTATLDEAKGEEIQEEQEENTNRAPHDVVYTLFMTLIPDNFVKAFFNNDLLAILISSIVVGYLIKPGNSSILRVVKEVNEMIVKVIAFVIKLAPIGVFFLILANMFKLDVKEMGTNLGLLIGGSVSSMMIHLFVILPILFFAFTRQNPYGVFFKSSRAWITAWGTASSAATLPVTLRVCRERGFPNTIVDFAVPLGCMINMDGTSIYFPMVVVFMAETQGITLNAGEYILLILLSTLSAIGTTPIPSSSLVLTIMICSSIGIPLTEMYAVVVAIDWFIDRFRTMVNVSGDIYAAGILTKVTGIRDPEILNDNEIGQVHSNTVRDNTDRV